MAIEQLKEARDKFHGFSRLPNVNVRPDALVGDAAQLGLALDITKNVDEDESQKLTGREGWADIRGLAEIVHERCVLAIIHTNNAEAVTRGVRRLLARTLDSKTMEQCYRVIDCAIEKIENPAGRY